MLYLPFDLETALKHPERVVTRDGRKVEELHYFKTVHHQHKLTCIICGAKCGFTVSGTYAGTNRDLDLFLLPEVKECWVNVYESNATGGLFTGCSYPTKERAMNEGKQNSDYIKTIRITNEPE